MYLLCRLIMVYKYQERENQKKNERGPKTNNIL